jgi:hypothetical protein
MEREKDTIQKDNESDSRYAYVDSGAAPEFSRDMDEDKTDLNIEDKTALISAKAEKLASATYMVTDIIPLSDPIRTKIKERCLDFVSDIYTAGVASYGKRIFIYRQVISTTEEICGLLGIAFSVGFVSGMNYSILRDEYSKLRDLVRSLDEIRGSVESSFTLKQDFFATDKMISSSKREGLAEGSVHGHGEHGSIKDKDDNRLSFTQKPKLESPKSSQRDINPEQSKNKRRDNILKILRKKKDVTIKDISKVIPGCSEKTIQRELLSMVMGGVLKKEGEKRWSRYSLK